MSHGFPTETCSKTRGQADQAKPRKSAWSISGEYWITLPEAIWLKVEGFGEGRGGATAEPDPKDLSQMDPARKVCDSVFTGNALATTRRFLS